MAKFYGEVGYASTQQTTPGVWTEVISERKYYGDVIRNMRGREDGISVNPNIRVSNSLSILADAYATQNFIAIRYVRWAGACWTVSNIDVRSPRLILEIGELYNGPQATASSTP